METSKASWHELQRFFASGRMLKVGADLDLVDVGCNISLDKKQEVEGWLAAGDLSRVRDEEALNWFEQEAELWALVVRPWVLVQDRT